jgi:hypothetical protein
MTSEENKEDKNALKWYHIRHIQLTGEYCAGTIAGFGLGVVAMVYVTYDHLIGSGWTLAMIPGMAMITLGASIQLHICQQRTKDNNTEN